MELTTDLIGEVFGKNYLRCEKCGAPMEIRYNRKKKSLLGLLEISRMSLYPPTLIIS